MNVISMYLRLWKSPLSVFRCSFCGCNRLQVSGRQNSEHCLTCSEIPNRVRWYHRNKPTISFRQVRNGVGSLPPVYEITASRCMVGWLLCDRGGWHVLRRDGLIIRIWKQDAASVMAFIKAKYQDGSMPELRLLNISTYKIQYKSKFAPELCVNC